jgi:hypothetical protein
MDSTGRFSLKNALTFDPAANNGAGKLTINADGAFSGSLTSEISLAAPIITGGSINIGPNVFQVNSAGRVIATNIQTAQIYGGSISIGGTLADPNFHVNSSGVMASKGGVFTSGSIIGGSISIGGSVGVPNFSVDSSGSLISRGPAIIGGSMTAGIFRTTDATNVNRIVIDGGTSTDRDKLKFINSEGGFFNLQISGYILEINNNYNTNPSLFSLPAEVRVRSKTRIAPTTNIVNLELYRTDNVGTNRIAAFYSNFGSTERLATEFLVNGNIFNINGGYGQISDERLKENIQSSRNYLEDLMGINVIKYNLIGDLDHSLLGFSAQQVETIFPNMVGEDSDGYLNVKTSIFIPMLVTAVQELNNRVKYLEEQVEVLNGN